MLGSVKMKIGGGGVMVVSSFDRILTSAKKEDREEMKRDEDFSFFCHSSTPYFCFFSKLSAKLPTRQKDQFAVAKPRPSSPHPQRQ
jgi:hypothetical protein